MGIRWILALAFGLAALCAAASAATRQPDLRMATASEGHIVGVFSLGDLAGPARIQVATRPARAAGGGFVPENVRLRERIVVSPTTREPVRFRTHGVLAPGTYYVAVSGSLEEPPPSCFPLRSHCAERWSRTLRVVVPAP
jgi:hypothetical protein